MCQVGNPGFPLDPHILPDGNLWQNSARIPEKLITQNVPFCIIKWHTSNAAEWINDLDVLPGLWRLNDVHSNAAECRPK